MILERIVGILSRVKIKYKHLFLFFVTIYASLASFIIYVILTEEFIF